MIEVCVGNPNNVSNGDNGDENDYDYDDSNNDKNDDDLTHSCSPAKLVAYRARQRSFECLPLRGNVKTF